MPAHDNVHVPSESWPGWTWYAIEFAIVLAASLVAAWKASDQLLPIVAASLGHGAALESWAGVTVHSPAFKSIEDSAEGAIAAMSNWVYYAIAGAVFGAWYLAARRPVLRRLSLI